MHLLVEACVDSVETARSAELAGAGRVELCGPGDGGTTPSMGMIERCRSAVGIPMHVMIRPHIGGFSYSVDAFETMLRDIDGARNLGANGVVFGVLLPDHTLDHDRMQQLIARARPMRVACHRAFDETPDAGKALDLLLALHVDIVLTSGHAPTALDGRLQLKRHVERAGQQLSVMAGGHVRSHNVRQIIAETGVREVHARGTDAAVFSDIMRALESPAPGHPS